MLPRELFRVPSVRLDPFTGAATVLPWPRSMSCRKKAITQAPASLQNGKRRPSLASRLASFATSVS